MSYMDAPAPDATVLIVDDDPDVRMTLKMHLELEHVSVVGEAADGFEAIQIAQWQKPRVVVLDDRMPFLNGSVAAPEIRSAAPGTILVAFSALYSSAMGVPQWADAIVEKDDVSQLIHLLRSLPPAKKISTKTTVRGPRDTEGIGR